MGAVPIEDRPGHADDARVGPIAADQAPQPPRVHSHVVVDERHTVRRGVLSGQGNRRGEAEVGRLGQDLDPRVGPRQEFLGAVGRIVVDADRADEVSGIVEGSDRIEARRQVAAPVERDQNDADRGKLAWHDRPLYGS
jgi:hypothetical protein